MEIRGNRLGKNEIEQEGWGLTAEMRSGDGKRTATGMSSGGGGDSGPNYISISLLSSFELHH